MVASLGGLEAVRVVLEALPAAFPAAVVVVQHGRCADDPARLTRLLSRVTPLPVRTARTGLAPAGPGVTVVPPGTEAVVDGRRLLRVGVGNPVRAGDTLLTSLAGAFGRAAIGVVLTGMLHDGSEGVRAVKRAGGRVLVQDPTTARAAGMPSSAIATGCVDFVLPVHRLAAALVTMVMAPGGAELLAVPTPAWARLHA